MSRTTDIERALAAIEGGTFQKLAEAYVYRKYELTSITALGSQFGTNKAAKGIPDAHSFKGDKVYLIGFTTQQNASVKKLERDIDECLGAADRAGIARQNIEKVICCHTCQRVSLEKERELHAKLPGRVELVGPDTLVKDLGLAYADLALDHLQVPVGSGAITTLEDFIAAENRRGYSTPHSKAMRGRDAEAAELETLIHKHRLVIVTGQSGIGKTKLALEAVKVYGANAHREALAMESRSCGNAAEDINRFLRETSAVVLVDDADQLVDLDVLLHTMLLNEDLRVVMTVRDYAMDKVMRDVRRFVEFERYDVSPLSDEDLALVLKEDYGIRNEYYIEQIKRVAKGNLRLAVMAGVQAIRHGYPSIRNAYDILDLFFEGFTANLSERELFALEQFSLCTVSDLEKGSAVFDALVEAGYSLAEIVTVAKRLSQMSILDIIQNANGVLAVRFEQQNVRDYLVFRALIRSKDVSLYEYISESMVRERGSLVTTINVLLGTFGDESTFEEVRRAATKYWLSLSREDEGARDAAMDVLHPLLSPYDLMYAQESIEASPPGTISTGAEYTRTATGPASTIMAILCGTKNGRRWAEGSSLIVSLIDHGGDETCSYKHAFEGGLAPNDQSISNGYADELALLRRMMDRLNENGTVSSNLCFGLMKVCELYLKRQHSEVAPSDYNTYVIKQWELPISNELIELRKHAIKGLVTLCASSPFASDAAKILASLFSGHFENDELRHADLESLSCCLRETSIGLEREEHLWYEVRESCINVGCDYAGLFNHILSPEYELARKTLDERRGFYESEVLLGAGDESLLALADYCGENAAAQFETYEYVRLGGLILLALAQRFEAQRTMGYLLAMCQSGISYRIPSYVIARLVDRYGFGTVRQTVIVSERSDMLTVVDGAIPESDITGDTIAKILEAQRSSEDTLSIGEVFRIDQSSPGFAHAFWNVKAPLFSQCPTAATRFFVDVNYEDEYVEMLDALVDDDCKELKGLYLLLAQNREFDAEDHILLYLIERSPSVVDDMIEAASNVRHGSDTVILRRLGCLSKLQDGFERLADAIDLIEDNFRWSNWLIASLFSMYDGRLYDGFKLADFVLYYIEQRMGNAERVALMRNTISELPINDRFLVFSRILARDEKGELLEVLPLYPLSFSGFGSEGFVPQYLDEIDMLKRLDDTLPHEPCFIKHRGYLSQIIRALESAMQEERWNNFHKRY